MFPHPEPQTPTGPNLNDGLRQVSIFKDAIVDPAYQASSNVGDPMKSDRTNGWLRGQLQAPT
jgi:hypothetical protein